MEFVIGKILDYSFFNDAKNYLEGKNQYFVRPSQHTLDIVIQELYDDSLEDEDGDTRPYYAERSTRMRDEGAWELVCNAEVDINTSHYRNTLWLSSEIEIVDANPTGPLELQYVSLWEGGYLGGYDELGKIVTGLVPNSGFEQYYVVYLPDRGVNFIDRKYLAKASPDYQKPPVTIAKIAAELLRVPSPEKVVVRLVPTKVLNKKVYLLLDGARAGHPFRPENIEICPDNELEKWMRFLVTPRVMQMDAATAAVLSSSFDDVAKYIVCLTRPLTEQLNNTNCFKYQPNGPDYVKVDEKDTTKVSYLPSSKVARSLEKGENPYESTMRVTVSWAKFVQAMFIPGIYTIARAEQFHNTISALCATEFGPEESKPELLIVHGDDIAKYYSLENYMKPQQGELWSSCMRSVRSGYFGIYVENPAQVGLLISRDRQSGKIFGRGLVWTTPMGTFLDRVYSNTQIEQKRMQVWAEKNGYVDIWNGRRGSFPSEISVQLESPYHQYYPYMDSMAYLNPNTGLLSNKGASGRYEIRSTGGDRVTAPTEASCAASQRIAPRAKMKATVSGDFALEEYLKELRTGGLEIEQKVVTDQVVGGYISTKQVAQVRVRPGGRLLNTLQSNPDFAFVAKENAFFHKDLCAFSLLDKAYILKEGAVEMPDGTFVSPDKADTYRRLLLRRQPNKARTTAPVPAPAKQVVQEEIFA